MRRPLKLPLNVIVEINVGKPVETMINKVDNINRRPMKINEHERRKTLTDYRLN